LDADGSFWQSKRLSDRAAIEIRNDVAEIARLVEFLEAFCARNGIPSDVAAKLTLTFDELLTNTMSYGFPDGGNHRIAITLSLDNDRFSAEIVDPGIAFDPLSQPQPDLDSPVENRQIGGLGIHFVRTLMDHVDYRRVNGQNRLILTKAVLGADT
jgi:serine/threonine-protein kinase RsbW